MGTLLAHVREAGLFTVLAGGFLLEEWRTAGAALRSAGMLAADGIDAAVYAPTGQLVQTFVAKAVT